MALHDRIVRETATVNVVGGGDNPFSGYVHLPNIVLLGDPGAGKSHLFGEFASAAGAEMKTARSFLNSDLASMKSSEVIFIDALDERRTIKQHSFCNFSKFLSLRGFWIVDKSLVLG